MAVDDFGPDRKVAVRDIYDIVDGDGSIVPLALSTALSTERAVELLPRLEATLGALKRYTDFVRWAVTDSMHKAQTPRMVVGDRVAELIQEDGDWVCNGQAMRTALAPFVGQEITQDEWEKCVVVIEPPVLYKAYHNVLNALSKRGSDALKAAIAAHREKPKRPEVLRIK